MIICKLISFPVSHIVDILGTRTRHSLVDAAVRKWGVDGTLLFINHITTTPDHLYIIFKNSTVRNDLCDVFQRTSRTALAKLQVEDIEECRQRYRNSVFWESLSFQ